MSRSKEETEAIKEEKKRRIREIRQEVLAIGDDIIHSDRFRKAAHVSHHLRFTVAEHSIEVAMYSLIMARWLKKRGFNVDENDAVRAALLHDIGMTEDSVHDSPSYKKAFSHPREGLRIARDEFGLNDKQLDAIRRHMWPIGIIPPKHKLGWILRMADNMSSINEGLILLRRGRTSGKKSEKRKVE